MTARVFTDWSPMCQALSQRLYLSYLWASQQASEVRKCILWGRWESEKLSTLSQVCHTVVWSLWSVINNFRINSCNSGPSKWESLIHWCELGWRAPLQPQWVLLPRVSFLLIYFDGGLEPTELKRGETWCSFIYCLIKQTFMKRLRSWFWERLWSQIMRGRRVKHVSHKAWHLLVLRPWATYWLPVFHFLLLCHGDRSTMYWLHRVKIMMPAGWLWGLNEICMTRSMVSGML